jgi:predicted O-methyltransferase YrrM
LDCALKYFRRIHAGNQHENLWLKLPDYGMADRGISVNLLTNILRDYASVELRSMARYCKTPQQVQYFEASFGEHYKLIQSLCKTLQLRNVVEVGTFTGMSALIWLLNDVSLTSIDIVPWRDFEDSVLSEDLILRTGFKQHILDISESHAFNEMIPAFTTSDLIFLDGPKDGVFEQKVVPQILDEMSGKGTWLLLDDIHLRAMNSCWEAIGNEKYDLSLIGHSTGTGLVRL